MKALLMAYRALWRCLWRRRLLDAARQKLSGCRLTRARSSRNAGAAVKCCSGSLAISASSVLMDQCRARRSRRSKGNEARARQLRPFNEPSFGQASDAASLCGQSRPMCFGAQLSQQFESIYRPFGAMPAHSLDWGIVWPSPRTQQQTSGTGLTCP